MIFVMFLNLWRLKLMKITDVKPIAMDRYLFVKIYTDEGITGVGQIGGTHSSD